MKMFMTRGGIPTFISKSEQELVDKIGESYYKNDLSEREAEIARILTSRGVLARQMDTDKGIFYVPNVNKDI